MESVRNIVAKALTLNNFRVTGLDPAAPLFLKTSPDSIRSTDAKFVDIIHTCGFVLGEIWPRFYNLF